MRSVPSFRNLAGTQKARLAARPANLDIDRLLDDYWMALPTLENTLLAFRSNQPNRPDYDYQDHRQHHRVFGDVLPTLITRPILYDF